MDELGDRSTTTGAAVLNLYTRKTTFRSKSMNLLLICHEPVGND